MYNFQARTIGLYLLASRLDEGEELFAIVQKSLEIFEAMSVHSVARKCAMRTKEIFDIVESRLRRDAVANTSESNCVAPSDRNLPGGFDDIDLSQDDFLTRLIDPEILKIFDSNTEYAGYLQGEDNQDGLNWVTGLMEDDS